MSRKLYIATSLHNISRYREVKAHFEQMGIIITYDWSVHGQVYNHDELRQYGIEEERGVIDAQVFLIILPGRNGAHYEMGMARVLGRPIVILEETTVEQKTFYHVPGNLPDLASIYKTHDLDDATTCVSALFEYHDTIGKFLAQPWGHMVQSIERFRNQ